MNIYLTPDLERIVNDELKSGHFRSPEEVIAKALAALREKEGLAVAADSNGGYESAVRDMPLCGGKPHSSARRLS